MSCAIVTTLLLASSSAFAFQTPFNGVRRSNGKSSSVNKSIFRSISLLLLSNQVLKAVATEKLYTFEKSSKVFAEAKVNKLITNLHLLFIMLIMIILDSYAWWCKFTCACLQICWR